MKTNNVWVQTNAKMITGVKRQLIEYNYAGSYGGSINLMQINNIIDSALIEIVKLQQENDKLKEALKLKSNEK